MSGLGILVVLILLIGSIGMNIVLITLLMRDRGKERQSKRKRDGFYLYLAVVCLVPAVLGILPSYSKWTHILAFLPTLAFFLYLYFDGESK